jgi:hypothetical protein
MFEDRAYGLRLRLRFMFKFYGWRLRISFKDKIEDKFTVMVYVQG